jgi:hypothetical protein
LGSSVTDAEEYGDRPARRPNSRLRSVLRFIAPQPTRGVVRSEPADGPWRIDDPKKIVIQIIAAHDSQPSHTSTVSHLAVCFGRFVFVLIGHLAYCGAPTRQRDDDDVGWLHFHSKVAQVANPRAKAVHSKTFQSSESLLDCDVPGPFSEVANLVVAHRNYALVEKALL